MRLSNSALALLLIVVQASGGRFSAMAGEFGGADFPASTKELMPKSKHSVYCRELNKTCEVRFENKSMTVAGYQGIDRSQFLRFRSDKDGHEDFLFYVDYIDGMGQPVTALFILSHQRAAREFGVALARWYEQDPRPYPNYRYPNSQGPQDTQGR